jgi:signal transduction histidine kinase/CheY-like chemotaxis protein
LLSDLRLRTKLLLSLILITACLSSATLLVVRFSGEQHAREEVVAGAHTSLLAFNVLLHQHQKALARKADLLATKAAMAGDEEDADGTQSSDDPLESDGSDLVAVADGSNNIVVLHASETSFPTADAREMLRRSLAKRSAADWWYVGGSLYQVALQQIGHGLGTVIVGREIDYRAVHDMGRISASQVVFSYDGTAAISTFRPIEEQETNKKLQDASLPRQIQIGDEQFFADSLELNSGSGPVVRLTVLKSYSEATAFLASLNHLLLGLGFLTVLVGAGFVFFISDAFTRPLADLLEGFRALERGDYAYPLHAHGGDEVAHATRAFDRMRNALLRNETQKKELEDQLRQAQKMEAMGRLAGGVAHDFNNLLTVIKGHSDLLLERLEPANPLRGSSQQIEKAADRAASLTRQLLAFSRMQVLQPKVVELNALVSEMGDLLTRLIREDIAFSFRPDEAPQRIKADPGQIEQVILNLTVNACDAMPSGGQLIVETHSVTVNEEFAQRRPPMQPGQYVLLTVTDTGEGMDANTKARIFEPFFTTKGLGKGTGLGLATVYGVVKQSGGYIWVNSEPGKGARFEVYLPQVHEPAEFTQSEGNAARHTHSRTTVLIAEDEDAVRELASEFLKSAGYTVLAAKDGTEALALAEASSKQIHILVTDVVMPNMRGPELAKQLKKLRSELRIVYMSGYLDYNRGCGEFLDEGFFLQKPFSREMLVSKVDEALKNESAEQRIARPVSQVTYS